MARGCPACGRPNSETASKCLYCQEPLTPADPALPSLPEATVSGRHLVILIPGEPPGESQIREFARIAGTSLYDARLSLSARRPRLFRKADSEAAARRLSEELSRGRFPHYVVSEASVLSLPVSRATGLDLLDRHLEVQLQGVPPATLAIPYSSLLLLVRGEIVRERRHEKRLSSTRGANRRLTSGLRLHLYEREATVAVEVEPESFDFRLLGADRTSSALLNLEKLVGLLSTRASGVEIDRGFDQEPAVLSRAGEEADIAQALSEGERDSVAYDNAADFRFYARWRYRLARHRGRAGA